MKPLYYGFCFDDGEPWYYETKEEMIEFLEKQLDQFEKMEWDRKDILIDTNFYVVFDTLEDLEEFL